MKDKANLYHIYCKVKNRIQREKQIIQSDQDVHVYGLWWMEWKLLLYDLSPYINSSESMAIFFSFLFFHGPSCVHIFFLDSPCLSSFFLFFNRNWGERPTHIVEHLFCGMSGWYNANFSKKYSKGCMVCTWILIMKAWKEFSQGSQQFDKAQCKNKQHMCVWFSRSIIIWLWLDSGISKRSFAKGFPNFQINFPST